ncbi:protein-export chaperone SecB [Xenorhabdus anantnagensis]|uniref:Protein-export chaperone SecB n=1 Tax=Xenorhabdus anantnagensis TaxID=3025875 RepID=A0ABT5M143_9GAMM|nr:protein-export chaperone SecB [Xenorhabdus anantnagensis]MDC9599000.1 protein-export chaperone SecB [Xenorhabdus anantnagensis]
MNFNIVNIKAAHIKLDEVGDPETPKKNNIHLKNTLLLDESDKCKAILSAKVKVTTESGFCVEFDYLFTLLFENEFNMEQEEDFWSENTVDSVVYPYIRAFISNLMNLSGYQAVNLPIMKF